MGIRDRPIAFRSPWQNAYVERLIGSIRRECLDHMIVFGQAHLRRILGAYAAYYIGGVHREADIRGMKRRRVVDPVAKIADDMALVPQGRDDAGLLGRRDPAEQGGVVEPGILASYCPSLMFLNKKNPAYRGVSHNLLLSVSAYAALV
jgi:transposase InsO family protein